MNNDDMKNAFSAYKEVANEFGKSVVLNRKEIRAKFPQQTLREILSPLPQEALCLGIIEDDGLPLLLNMSDSLAGSVLITAPKNHKVKNLFWTSMYMTMHNLLESRRTYYDISFAVITTKDEEFYMINSTAYFGDVALLHSTKAEDMLLSLASWAYSTKSSKSLAVLFIDCLDDWMDLDFDARQNLKWLLLHGHKHGVRIIAHATKSLEIKELFGIHIDTTDEVNKMLPAEHYAIRENGKKLVFWSPKID